MIRLLPLLLLVSTINKLQAQPFDTLLTQFVSIGEIYPLLDSTFILIGENNSEILVERINQKAEVLWSLPVISTKRDYLENFKFTVNDEDSTFQISTADKHCDYSSRELYKSFTISFNGTKLDSQTVSFGENFGYIFLLSGAPDRPRLGYIMNDFAVLVMANGDTLQLHFPPLNGDTSLTFIFGKPKTISICPNGDIIVGTYYGVYIYRLENIRYELIDLNTFGHREILCLEDSLFIAVNKNSLQIWEGNIPSIEFNLEENIYPSPIWRDPLLAVQVSPLYNPDTVFFLDRKLQLKHKVVNDAPLFANVAIQNETTYKAGGGSIYFDPAVLQSENHITHEGPKYYNVELVDFNPGPYTSAQLLFWDLYFYDIPHASVTLTNHSDYTINSVTIAHGTATGFCSDSFWQRELTALDLSPGETGTFDIYDIFIIKAYPDNRYSRVCMYALRPDNHYDDNFDDNEFCKKIDLLPSLNLDMDSPIHHSPTIIKDDIRFVSPEKIEFELTVFDFSGKPVFVGLANTYSGTRIDLGFLPAGIYIFQYYIHAEKKRYAEKILKSG